MTFKAWWKSKPLRWLVGSSVILAAALIFLLYGGLNGARVEELKIHTDRGVYSFMVEIATTSKARSRGLMGRDSLAENTGMLFHYGKPREIRMWMKDTPLSLDMVFIRRDGVVHRIEPRVQPFSLTTIYSQGDVVACLEVAGGTAERLGLKVGDRVEHRFFGE